MILVVRGCRLADYLRVASTTKGVGADVVSVYLVLLCIWYCLGFLPPFCTCMLVYVLFRSGGNSLRCNCFLTGWVVSVTVVASNFPYFSRGWAVYC